MGRLELRMYGLVPYNISPIQQGIQFGHAVVEYGRTCEGMKNHENHYKSSSGLSKSNQAKKNLGQKIILPFANSSTKKQYIKLL